MTKYLRRLGVGGDNIGRTLVIVVWLVSFVVLLVTVPRGKTPTGIGSVSGDGIYYYVQLESLVQDHDLDFANNLEQFRHNPYVAKQLDSGVLTPTGRTPNLFSIGPAILWAPVYLLLRPFTIAGLGGGLFAPPIATILYALVGLLAAYGACRLLGLGKKLSGLSVAAAYLGTNLVYYATFEASMSHGLGFAAVSLLLYLALRWKNNLDLRRALVLGLIAGVCFLVRWQLLLVSVPILIFAFWKKPIDKAAIKKWAAALLGLVVGIAPQLIVWKRLYGRYLIAPQGGGFFQLNSPHFGEVLVSTKHGLLTWTPLVILAIAGLIVATQLKNKQDQAKRAIGFLALAILALQTYINGTLLEWWGGDAFGARRFTDIAAIFIIGLAILFASLRTKWARVLVFSLTGLAVIANLTLMQLYRTDKIPRAEPLHWRQLREAF